MKDVKLVSGFVLILIFISCGLKPKRGAPLPTALPAPFGLRAEAANGKAKLYWSINRQDNIPVSGYNIYLAENISSADTLAWKLNSDRRYNQEPYPGDTDGDISRESMPLENLSNGKKYYALIRTVGIDGRESAPSNVAAFTPLGQGEFSISANHESSDGGFDFADGKGVPGRDPRSDIYLYVMPDKIGLSSPSRLGAGLRQTSFQKSGSSAFQLETIQISGGDEIIVKTKYGKAAITVLRISGDYPDIAARLSYIYYPNRH